MLKFLDEEHRSSNLFMPIPYIIPKAIMCDDMCNNDDNLIAHEIYQGHHTV